jgi:O-antigen/teichoic acid export membrane protein
MNVLYLRALVVMVSLLAGAVELGLYTAAFRVVELFLVLPPVLVGVALPLLSVAAAEDLDRLRVGVQAIVETAVLAALGTALVISVLAEPALDLLGGAEYVGGAEMLRLQVWALVPLSVGSVLGYVLFTLGRQRDIARANAVVAAGVLTAGLALVALYGGVGAAIAGVGAETVLLVLLAVALRRVDRSLLPRMVFAWRPAVALGAGAVTLLAALPAWVDGAVAGAVFLVVGVAVGAVPRPLVLALLRRAPGDRR